MIETFISYRGNQTEVSRIYENTYSYVNLAIQYGFDVMVDAWYYNDSIMIGSDRPRARFDGHVREMEAVWYRARDVRAFYTLINDGQKVIYSEKDDLTPVANTHLVFTRKLENVIIPEITVLFIDDNYEQEIPHDLYAVCSDTISDWRERITGEKAHEWDLGELKPPHDFIPESFFDDL